RVDRDRVAPEQLERAVRLDASAIARDRVALATDGREGLRGLLGVLEVAERNRPAAREPADLVGAGRDESGEVLLQHAVVGREHEVAARRLLARGGELRRLRAALRRADRIEQPDVRQEAEQVVLQRRGGGPAAP